MIAGHLRTAHSTVHVGQRRTAPSLHSTLTTASRSRLARAALAFTGTCALLVAGVANAAAQTPVATPSTHPDAAIDRILTRLEERKIDDLKAKVVWTVTDALLGGDGQSKKGTIWYKEMKPCARFKVHFDRLVRDKKKFDLNEQHMFDGRWYIELRSENKVISRHELRYEDEVGNPYKLGEGMFPVPFGQKKADILSEFDVTRSEASDDPKDTDHLKLVPRSGSRTGERYTQIDFWIQKGGRDDGLPLKVRTHKKDGTGKANQIIDIEFSDVKLNNGMSDSEFRIETPAGYLEEKDPLPPREAPGHEIPAGESP